MALNVYSHNPNSEGAKALAAALGVKRIKREGSRYVGTPNKNVINWGATALPENVAGASIINKPDAVRSVSDKLRFFQKCRDNGAPRTPEFTTDRQVVLQWLAEGKKVVARTVLNGHSGEGIVILEGAGVDIPVAPLYTVYVPKKQEWRIHVFRRGNNLKVIDMQRKIRDPDFDGVPDWNVRSHANGFIFAREVDPPNPDILNQAIKALEISGLDFGAVDVIWNEHNAQAYVLEINSAPGLVGQTVRNYAEAFRELM